MGSFTTSTNGYSYLRIEAESAEVSSPLESGSGAEGFDGGWVRLRGTLIYRQDQSMIEVVPGSVVPAAAAGMLRAFVAAAAPASIAPLSTPSYAYTRKLSSGCIAFKVAAMWSAMFSTVESLSIR